MFVQCQQYLQGYRKDLSREYLAGCLLCKFVAFASHVTIIWCLNPHSEEIPVLGELKFGLDDGQFNVSDIS